MPDRLLQLFERVLPVALMCPQGGGRRWYRVGGGSEEDACDMQAALGSKMDLRRQSAA
ncbi:hypothetical protein AB0M41_25995 [Streptomyces sp. NPDC051896]|uniref:hypothetical protein n=1 Tax=Streptomyces sp. NPDC051896 TaxID=3155416 RepID=UPI00342015BB